VRTSRQETVASRICGAVERAPVNSTNSGCHFQRDLRADHLGLVGGDGDRRALVGGQRFALSKAGLLFACNLLSQCHGGIEARNKLPVTKLDMRIVRRLPEPRLKPWPALRSRVVRRCGKCGFRDPEIDVREHCLDQRRQQVGGGRLPGWIDKTRPQDLFRIDFDRIEIDRTADALAETDEIEIVIGSQPLSVGRHEGKGQQSVAQEGEQDPVGHESAGGKSLAPAQHEAAAVPGHRQIRIEGVDGICEEPVMCRRSRFGRIRLLGRADHARRDAVEIVISEQLADGAVAAGDGAGDPQRIRPCAAGTAVPLRHQVS